MSIEKKDLKYGLQGLYENLGNHFLSGTRYWGINKFDSDWDIVVPFMQRESILKFLKSKNVEVKHSIIFKGFSFVDGMSENPFPVNIIPLKEIDYMAWKVANENMVDFIDMLPLLEDKLRFDKLFRIATFEGFKHTVKSSLLVSGTIEEHLFGKEFRS